MGQIQTVQEREGTIRGYFGRNIKKLESHLQGIIKPEAFLAAAMTSIQGNDKLLECRPDSLFTCLMESAQLRLVPGKAIGHAYLVPYKNTCTFIIGYRGMIELATRGGKVRKIEARTVHEGDHFDFGFGFEPFIDHKPSLEAENKTKHNLLAVYAVATLKDGTHQVDVLRPDEIEAARQRSQSGKNNNGPWGSDYLEMARKTAVRRLCKYLPLSLDVAQAIGEDEQRELAPRDVALEDDARQRGDSLQELTAALEQGADDDEPWSATIDEVEEAEYEEVAKPRVAKKKVATRRAKPEPEPESPAAHFEGADDDFYDAAPWDDELGNGGYLIDVNDVYDSWPQWCSDECAYTAPALRGKSWRDIAMAPVPGPEQQELIKIVHAAVKSGLGDARATKCAALVVGFHDARTAG